MEIIRVSLGLIFVVLATYGDFRTYKIKNSLVLTFLLVGLAFNIATGGINGGIDALQGSLLPLALFPLFALRMLGAGDIKAFCALGSILGWAQNIQVIIYSFIASGIIALGFMIARRNAIERFKALGRYLKASFYMRTLLPYEEFTDAEGKFRFAYGIFGGYVISILKNIGLG